MLALRRIFLGLACATWVSSGCSPEEEGGGEGVDQACGFPLTGEAERVIDGDTIELVGGERIRYLLIDTPELSGGEPECLAEEARDLNQQLVDGQALRFEYDPIQCLDIYERRLAYVFVDDVMVNETLVRRGFAEAFIYFAEGVSGEYIYADQIEAAEDAARDEGRGIWSLCEEVGGDG